ncbi:MAG: VWA domain-containing protein, partial [Candidatus Omnitrophica bacterium]|nr:VWA domain-containing protein [Candidatus Omnitrophota bacterium]
MKNLLMILSLISLANIFFPQSGWCSRVKVYADVDKPIILAGSDERVVLKVGLLPQDDSRQKRLFLNIAVVLDKSGSMASNQKIENAKRGVIEIIQRMEKGDIFALITYDTHPRLLIPAQVIEDKDSLIDYVWSITAGGSTALYGGVELGAIQVRRHLGAQYLNRVVLLSDGLANVGPQNTQDLAQLGNRLSREGITVSTIGLGLDYNEDLMAALAQEGEGNFYFSRNSDELPMIFAEEIGEAATLLAQNINVAIECADGVAPSAILGRKGAVHQQSMSADINSLYGKNEKYALFEMRPPQGEDGKTITLATVKVEYHDPFTKKRVT